MVANGADQVWRASDIRAQGREPRRTTVAWLNQGENQAMRGVMFIGVFAAGVGGGFVGTRPALRQQEPGGDGAGARRFWEAHKVHAERGRALCDDPGLA